MKDSHSVANVIKNMSFSGAIEYVINNLNGTREPMGHHNIARFKVKGSDYNSVMFYNHEGNATEPTFNFND